MELSDALDQLTLKPSTLTNPFDSLPDELLALIIDFALPTPPPPESQARPTTNGVLEEQRGAGLRRIASVDKRFRRVSHSAGELVLWLGKEGMERTRDEPVHKLTVIVVQGEEPPPALPRWMLDDLRVLVVAFRSTGLLPSLGCFGEGVPLSTLTELNVFSETGASCVSGPWITNLLARTPNLETLRLSHPDGSVRPPPNFSLETLQLATLKHLHLTTPSPKCLHGTGQSGSRRYLKTLLQPFRANLRSFTFDLPEEEEPDPSLHLLSSLLPHTPALQSLFTARYTVIDPVLALLPSLHHLKYLRLIHLGDTPAVEHDPSYWSWTCLAESVVKLLQASERHVGELLVDVRCEGTLRKYDVAQKGSVAAFSEAARIATSSRMRGLTVLLQFWEGHPPYRAWPRER